MSEPRAAERDSLAERLVVELGAAFHQRAIYPSAHPQVRRSLERTVDALEAWCRAFAVDEISLILLEDQLLVDRSPLPEEATWRRGLVLAFSRLGLSGLSLSHGLDVDELARFLDEATERKDPHASRHIQVGRAAYFEGKEGGAGEVEADARQRDVSGETLEAARGELEEIARGAAARIDRLRGLIAQLARAAAPARVDLATSGATGIADRAFRHGLAVALGALRIGRRIGLAGEPLEELGLAGLLHDIGHLEPGDPAESPDRRRRLHPVRGAARLAALEGVSDAVVLATYEHHLRFDGAESYPRLARPRRPGGLARAVAVADTWASMRAVAALAPRECAEVLDARAGTFLDPELVELFLPGLVPPDPAAGQ